MQPAQEKAPGFCKGSCANFPWLMTLRVIGGILGILIIVLGFISIFTGSINPKTVVNACYRILFGILIILAELRMEKWLKFFTFLTSYLGLGLFYVFVGGLALGGDWYEIVLAICFLAVGIVYINMGCCYRQKMYSSSPAAPAAPAAAVSNPAISAASRPSSTPARQQEMVQFEDDTPASAWPEMDERV